MNYTWSGLALATLMLLFTVVNIGIALWFIREWIKRRKNGKKS